MARRGSMTNDQRYRHCVSAVGLLIAFALNGQDRGAALEAFTEGYARLDPDPFYLDIRERLEAVPQDSVLMRQEAFFAEQREILNGPFEAEGSEEASLLLDLARF
ncbi:MAG TPA: hypothetical protein PKN30_10915, partial [Flavobacteriales bacterium]|nr:hypothetical protein [Flavobacteriales bacterium]